MRRHGPRTSARRHPTGRRCRTNGSSVYSPAARSDALPPSNAGPDPCAVFVCCQSDPKMIKEIIDAVTIPVMAKVRI